MKYLGLVSLVYLAVAVLPAGAAQDQFIIQAEVGADNVAPTTPQNVNATALSDTEIDVTWDAATDNFAVGGYQVFRDTVQIATTTLTSYSDAGLTASTSYDYTIRTFDTSFNVSAQSATATATTLEQVIVPEENEPNDGGQLIGQIGVTEEDITIVTATTTATVSLESDYPSRVALAWGRSSDYELGYSVGAVFKTNHRVVIANLDPGTIYELRVIVTDEYGRENIITTTFRTQAGRDVTAPANPLDFSAAVVDGRVQLRWQNPTEADFAYVRLVSNDQFYPLDQFAGYPVYQGARERASDERAMTTKRRYYSIFSYDTAGNVSSGAVTEVLFDTSAPPAAVAPPGIFPEGQLPVSSTTPQSSTTPGAMPNDEGIDLQFTDIQFVTESGVAKQTDTTVYLQNDTNTLIRIPYDVLPEHLKTIVVRLTHPREPSREFAFLLKVNAEKTAYEARIGALTDIGVYGFVNEIFDYKTQRISTTTGSATVQSATVVEQFTDFVWTWRVVPLLGLLLIGLFFFLTGRRREQPEDRSV